MPKSPQKWDFPNRTILGPDRDTGNQLKFYTLLLSFSLSQDLIPLRKCGCYFNVRKWLSLSSLKLPMLHINFDT
ncbi:hypothetical protein ES332_A10G079000v1 [Gossypium tomentosum]|uniref:Uncharacterized protein n=1 Tax=Gossypium tomentosum TaxID=34277 RepID=A0A5D2NSP8_GOSTO|nr:hypothetical protein ES332_A10G079000v1 [Gossypium tomentosum]